MPIYPPRMPSSLVRCSQLSDLSERALAEESTLSQLLIDHAQENRFDFSALEIRASRFENCTFSACRFSHSTFIDVCFENCDFSNSTFTDAYFERCQFLRCKYIGAQMQDTRWKSVLIQGTNFELTYLDGAKMTDIIMDDSNFSNVSWSEANLKKVQNLKCRFVRNNFFQTALAGMDFSCSELAAPIVSASGAELKDCEINALQAADLITLWGVKIKK